jgi:adenylate kinase family enzyme
MRVAILGNSGSGKSTLANWLARSIRLAVLDLDSVAWVPDQPAVARPSALAQADVTSFCNAHERWVVEGCYGDLIEAALQLQPRLIFLNPGLESCIGHCRSRPWEPHKYPSEQARDANLKFLLTWVAEYYTRQGPMSFNAHQALFAKYGGQKLELQREPQLDPPDEELLAWLR